MSREETREFRVAWKRAGWRRKSTTFKTVAAAERRAERIRTGDPHWRCDEGHGYYSSDGPDREWIATCMPDLVEGPVVEVRDVGPWRSADPS